MEKPYPRREFLRTVGATAMVAAIPASAASAGARAAQASTTAASKPRLFAGCCAYSFSKYLESKRMSMEDFILKGVEMGVQGVDMTTYWFKSTDPDYLAHLRQFAYKNGMPFSGAAIGTNMCLADPAKRAEELAKIKQWVDRTELLGASHLRVFGGEVPAGASDEQAIQWVVEIMKPACEYAAKKGIILGIESHGGITSKAANIIEIVRRVDLPNAGINLDISNFPENEYAQIEACIPYATHAHIRDDFTEGHGPIDFDRVWQLFAKGGYKGYMSAEYEGKEDAMTGVPKLIAKIKTFCQKYSTA
ncbi:MAG: sugar phosphate isomerase/epimerase family protein [Terriglobia bacterium]